MTTLMLAFLAGLVTILNPCVLPLVPLVVSSALSKSKFGPIALVIGLVASFTVMGLAVLSFGFALGIEEHIVRMLAGALLVLAGGFMLVPRLQLALSTAGAPISRMAGDRLDRFNQDSVAGQGFVGALLGVVWAPCVGPTLGVAIAAASTGRNLAEAFVTFLFFGLGIGTSVLAFAYGSRRLLRERRSALMGAAKYGKMIFGAAMVIVGAMVISGFDKLLEARLLDWSPQELVNFTTRF